PERGEVLCTILTAVPWIGCCSRVRASRLQKSSAFFLGTAVRFNVTRADESIRSSPSPISSIAAAQGSMSIWAYGCMPRANSNVTAVHSMKSTGGKTLSSNLSTA
ncbi:unnamed protein product, partial [Ectocarpus sp. 12 AP-2014]